MYRSIAVFILGFTSHLFSVSVLESRVFRSTASKHRCLVNSQPRDINDSVVDDAQVMLVTLP